MLRLLRKMIARMGLAGALVLSLAFAAPAFAAEVCIDRDCLSGAAFETAPADGEPCPDCGPACANGCCHAPHAATVPDLSQLSLTGAVTTSAVWTHAAQPPLDRPAGPDRPPRA